MPSVDPGLVKSTTYSLTLHISPPPNTSTVAWSSAFQAVGCPSASSAPRSSSRGIVSEGYSLWQEWRASSCAVGSIQTFAHLAAESLPPLNFAKRLVYLANRGLDQPTDKQRSEHEVHTTDVHQGRGCWRRLDCTDEYPGLRPAQRPQAQRITPTSGARAGRPLVRVVRDICAELPLAPGPPPSYH